MPLLGLLEGHFCFYSLSHWMCVQFCRLLLAEAKWGTTFMLKERKRDYVNSLSLWETWGKWLFQKLLPSFQGQPNWDKSDTKVVYLKWFVWSGSHKKVVYLFAHEERPCGPRCNDRSHVLDQSWARVLTSVLSFKAETHPARVREMFPDEGNENVQRFER